MVEFEKRLTIYKCHSRPKIGTLNSPGNGLPNQRRVEPDFGYWFDVLLGQS